MGKAFQIWLSPELRDLPCLFDFNEVTAELDKTQPDFHQTKKWSFQGVTFDVDVRAVALTKDNKFSYELVDNFKCKKVNRKGVLSDAISGALFHPEKYFKHNYRV